MTDPGTDVQILDVRGMPKPQKHPAIFAAFDGLSRGEAFILVNDHDPKHLHDEFESDRAGSYSWDYVNQEPRDWQIRIGKVSDAPPPPARDSGESDRPSLPVTDISQPATDSAEAE